MMFLSTIRLMCIQLYMKSGSDSVKGVSCRLDDMCVLRTLDKVFFAKNLRKLFEFVIPVIQQLH